MENYWIWIVFTINVGLTLWHLTEEFQGKLWQYFGAIAGYKISDAVGISLFTVGLGFILLLAAIFGILGLENETTVFQSTGLIQFGMGFLIGARVSDWWNSHYSKWKAQFRGPLGYRGNPGLLSSWFYLVDAAILTFVVTKYPILLEGIGFIAGLVLGIGFFFAVIPVIRLFGRRLNAKREEPWKRNEKMPDWART